MITADEIVVNMGGVVKTEGVMFKYVNGIFEFDTHIDKPLKLENSSQRKFTEASLYAKFGIRTQFGNAIRDTKSAIDTESQNSGVAMINNVFGMNRAIASWMSFFRAPIQAGPWLEASFSQTDSDSGSSQSIVSRFEGEKINYSANEADFEGTQIHGEKAEFRANKFTMSAAAHALAANSKHANGKIIFPLGNMISSSASLGFGKSRYGALEIINARIEMGDSIFMQINGDIRLSGANLEANNIEIEATNLILESLHSMVDNNAKGASISLGEFQELSDMVKSVGGNYARGSKNWVEEIASIVGHDKVKIIISDILEITGAIISQGDPDLSREIEEEKEASIQANKIIAKKIFGYDDFAAVGMNLNLRGTDAKSTGDWDGSIAYRNLKQRICPTIAATFEAKEVFGEIHRDASTAEKITGLEFEEIRINHREHNFTLPTWEEFKDNIKTTLSRV